MGVGPNDLSQRVIELEQRIIELELENANHARLRCIPSDSTVLLSALAILTCAIGWVGVASRNHPGRAARVPSGTRLPPAPPAFCLLGALGHFACCFCAITCIPSAWTNDDALDGRIRKLTVAFIIMYAYDMLFAFGLRRSTLRGFSKRRFFEHHVPAFVIAFVAFALESHPDWPRMRLLIVAIYTTQNVEGFISLLHFLQGVGVAADSIEELNDHRFAPAALTVLQCFLAVLRGMLFDLIPHYVTHGRGCVREADPACEACMHACIYAFVTDLSAHVRIGQGRLHLKRGLHSFYIYMQESSVCFLCL